MTFEEITDELETILRDRILVVWGHAVDRVFLEVPPRTEMGDLASPVAMELARHLKRSPREIASKLVEGFPLPVIVAEATVEGPGYVNFRIDRNLFTASLVGAPFHPPPMAEAERILVEHTNINPNKAAHIGHLRNAVLGDTLVRCLRWLGHSVETQNYIDDTGVQVADVVVGFQKILGEDASVVRGRIGSEDVPFDYFCWDLYARVAKLYDQNDEAKQWRLDTLHEIESQEGPTAELGALIADAIVYRHVQTMSRVDIRYDVLTEESDIIKHRFWQNAFELLKTSGAVVKEAEGRNAGCWIMKLSESPEFAGLEDPDKVIVRSNGTVTYVGKDIAYQLWKFGLLDRTFGYRRFLTYPDGHVLWQSTSDDDADSSAPDFGGADRVYNVIDNRQSYLQKIVREGLRLLGYEKEADHSIHFAYEMVALSAGTARALGVEISDEDHEKAALEMSGRKGLGVKADDLLDQLETKAVQAVEQGLSEERAAGMSPEDLRGLAHQIAVAALRYFMLKFGRNRVIAFDLEEALTFEGDSGPYLQYSAVRAQNIFRKMDERDVSPGLAEDERDQLTIGEQVNDEIWEIVRLSATTSMVVRRSVEALELSMITHHALELCQKFNSFYHKYPILNEEDHAERRRRAACASIFLDTMRGILGLLGLAVPERM